MHGTEGKDVKIQSVQTSGQDLHWTSRYMLKMWLQQPLHQWSDFSVFFHMGLAGTYGNNTLVRSVVKIWAKHIEDNGLFDRLRWFYMDFYYRDG